jgi:alpha-galactosidase
VVCAVARRRGELWEQDYRVARACGFEHPYGENGGPGALFHALRSFHLVHPICRDVEELCPEALFLNFTNPEARVLQSICDLTGVRAVGICHGIFAAAGAVAHYLERDKDDLRLVSAGVNHFYDVLKVIDKKTGEDLRDELLRRVATKPPPVFKHKNDVRLFRKMVEIFGVFSYPSDSHIGEYVAWGSTFCGARWQRGREFKPIPTTVGVEEPALADYADGKAPLDERICRRSGEITMPIIGDIELNRGSFREAVNVRNDGGWIENLPTDAVVEVPAEVDAQGLHPVRVGALPEAFAALIRTQLAINKLTVRAFHEKSKKLLLQTLLLDPFVNNVLAAEAYLDEMLALQKDFLPEFV